MNQQQPSPPTTDNGPDIIFLNFADAKVPVFKEDRNKDYIKYGEDNLFPEFLSYLYNKSGKHGAIINAKTNYIFGNGYENGDFVINRLGQSLNDISKRCILDRTIYGGFKLEVIWGFNQKIAEIVHVDFNCIRKGKEGGFFHKENWKATNRDEPVFIPAFDPSNPVGSQIFEYNEYRPGVRFYPYPEYLAMINYILTDIEIGKYYLSAISNGMMPSKMIQLFMGDLTPEKKGELERQWRNKFSGAENAGKFILVNNPNKDKAIEVTDLSANELDKHFQELNKTCQQEIFSGHSVTSPMLFGIKTEGQLGGNTELQISYSIFQNTYSKPKAHDFDKEMNWLLSYSNFAGKYELQPTDPIGIILDVKDFVNILPTEFVLDKLGVPVEMRGGQTVTPGAAPEQQLEGVNSTLTNLTGRQLQNIMRVVRQYDEGRGKINRAAAIALLKSGYGLTDDEVVSFLGEEPAPLAMSAQNEDSIIEVFDSFGESKHDYEIMRTRKQFSADVPTEEEERVFVGAFLTYDITATENRILELIKKDGKITADVIASVIGETVRYVETRIKSLTDKGYLESTLQKIGADEVMVRTVPKAADITAPPSRAKVPPTQIYVKYSYEGPQDSRNRPFCAKLLQLNRLYSRADIEKISQRLGYSVFDRRGGFYNNNGVVTPYCRHSWFANVIVKKGGENV